MVKIAHTADIHIRSLSRHDEYRQVLKYFIDDCRESGVEHVFIGGDIFHTKTTGISPEYIDFLTWWLSSMARHFDVHMVLGNHDGNLLNQSRQDAVTPIVDAMSHPRVKLYKRSGVYPIVPGFDFCVFSCFDEDGWKNVRPQPGNVSIATFHGPVAGSLTEVGWGIEDGVPVSLFQDFDFCFLGDIHRPQVLGRRDGKPWIAYPGTPIQQNYAEQLEHGYLLWNIKGSDDWDVVTRPLPNVRPFVTLDWAGSVEATLTEAMKHPISSRFRVRSQSHVSSGDFHVLSEALRAKLNASEVTYKSDQQSERKSTIAESDDATKKENIRSSDYVVKLLREFHKDVHLTLEESNSVTEKIKSYLETVSKSDEVSRNSKWKLRRLRWDNLFAYGADNEIDFTKLKGVVGIFGPNRTGKSSIVGTLMYSLFNSTDRGSIKNIDVCNIRKDYCSSQVTFDHDGSTYVLERKTKKSTNKKGVVSAATTLDFFKVMGDMTVEDMCGEQRSDTDKGVRRLIGSSEDFLMTSLSAQGETCNFIAQGSSRRRTFVAKFLDLDVFDRMHDLASKELSSLKSQLKALPDRDWDLLSREKSADLSTTVLRLKELEDSLVEEQASLDSLRRELALHDGSPVTQEEVDVQRRKVESLTSKVTDCDSRAASLKSEVADLQTKLQFLRDSVSLVDLPKLKERLAARSKLEGSVVNLKLVHEKEDKTLTLMKKSAKTLDEVPCGDSFPTCKFITDAHLNRKKLQSQSKKTEDSLRILKEAESALAAAHDDGLTATIDKHEKMSVLADKIELEISRKETEVERCRSTCDVSRSELVIAEKKLKSMEEALNNQENAEVCSIRNKMKETSDVIRKHDAEKVFLAGRCGKLTAELERLNEERSWRDGVLREVKVHEFLSNGLSKRGAPLLVMKSQLPVVNAEVARILRGIVDFAIELESDDDTDALEVYINYGDSRRVIELCSGMEKTMAAIAIRVALLNVSSLPRPDFLIIDEGFGTLDNSGVEACNRFLSSLKSHFSTIIVITHVDGVKDSADHVIEITKNEKDSRVVFS